jgi:hypothetical protein
MTALHTLLILLFTSSAAFGDSIWLGTFSSPSGGGTWEVDSKQVETTPSWSGSGNCPFDIGKLSDLAFAFARVHAVPSNEIRLRWFRLERFVGKHKSLEDKWYVTFNFSADFRDVPSSVLLLTDGTVIKPSIVKKE